MPVAERDQDFRPMSTAMSTKPAPGKNQEVDPSDPRVKKLVYSMYRDMLTNYSDNAATYIESQDPSNVTQDFGVVPIIQTILRGGNPSESGTVSQGAPPPPPPMAPPGAIPAVRLSSEIGPRSEKGPPAALAGAMMKDKKPFTYTPGGIDLSEIRSPRMAKRLQMNAAAEGVTSVPKAAGEGQGKLVSSHHGPLPPASVAAMQGQMAFCVFPQGPPPTLNRHKSQSSDVTDTCGERSSHPPPPPPMKFEQNSSGPPPPPPMAPHMMKPSQPPPPQNPAPPTSGMHPIAALFRQQQSQQQSLPYEQSPEEPQPPQLSQPTRPSNKGSIYIQPLTPPTSPPYQRQASPPPPPPRSPQPQRHPKPSQNLGSIYIPPIQPPLEQVPMNFSPPPAMPSGTGGSGPQQSGSVKSPPSGNIPQLKKTVTPWMNSHNKMVTKQAESPPYVNPANISTPWGTIGGPPATPANGGTGLIYTIPIAMTREESGSLSPEVSKAKAAQHLGRVIPIQIQRQTSLNKEHQLQAQQEHGWPCPRTIPIQIERTGGGQRGQKVVTPGTPSSYNTPMGLYSAQNVGEAYNNQQAAAELGSGVKSMTIADQERQPVQSKSMKVIQKVAENELRRLSSMEEDHPQCGAGYPYEGFGSGWPQHQHPHSHQEPIYCPPQFSQDPSWRMNEFLQDDQNLANIFGSQADDQSSTEPRFRGGNIPSRAFKTLQTTLPPPEAGASSPGARTSKVQITSSNTGPIMHNIPIQMSSCSPTPSSGPHHQIPMSSSSPIPPSEQRAPSPKKYMGAHIPGRSFKILQAMTAPDDANLDLSPSSASSDSDNLNILSEPCSPCPDSFSWQYWWYYVSCYWAGYDMTGYEYPPGWDPSNPYFPPELAPNFGLGPREPCDSEYYDEAETEDDATNNTNYAPVDYWSEEDSGNAGVVEEPSSSSHDSDAGTIVDETGLQSPSCLIEEYFSSSESESSTSTIINVPANHTTVAKPLQATGASKHFLSTIEELTENSSSSRGSTPQSPKSALPGDEEEPDPEIEDQEVDDEVDEVSSEDEEVSSVSVIENKSASQSQQSFSISRREDETSSSSSSSSSEDEEEDRDAEEATAVTVRLPLKLSFGKTKSYKDITTVLVGDVGVEEKGEESREEEFQEEEDNEPVVSFTISLSRQSSREDKAKEEIEEVAENQEADQEEEVDFWSKIVCPSSTKEQEEQITVVSDDYWGSFTREEEPEQEPEQVDQEFKPAQDFWGQITPEEDKKSPEEAPIVIKLGKSPSKIGMSWDTEFNFWDKSLRTIETRRFSSNFEISEDYESDSGMKSDSGQRVRQQKHKVKKYKRHSTPAGLPVMKGRSRGPSCTSRWDVSTDNLAKEPGPEKREPFSFLWSEDSFSVKLREMWIDEGDCHDPVQISTQTQKESKVTEDEVNDKIDQELEIGEVDNIEIDQDPEVDETEVDQEPGIDDVQTDQQLQVEQDDQPVEAVDLSAGWSAWEGWDVAESKNATSNDATDFSPDVDVQVSLSVPDESVPDGVQEEQDEDEVDAEYVEEDEEEEEYEYEGELEEKVEEEEVEEIEAEVEVKEVFGEKLEENSEESSKSSGDTVKVANEEGCQNTEGNSDESFKSTVTKLEQIDLQDDDDDEEEEDLEDRDAQQVALNEKQGQDPETTLEKAEQTLEIQEIPASIKLDSSPPTHDHTHDPSHTSPNTCTCHIDSQLSRAESLLWRIERFLHASLSLGSEDDSGVMTDLSRPISDVDTDPELNPDDCSPREQSSHDLLLTTTPTAPPPAPPVVLRRPPVSSSSRSLREQAATNRANPNQSQSQSPAQPYLRRTRPQSLIMLESSIDTEFQEASNSVASAAKTRSRSAERKKYQKAKTHSRLFQLLQDECATDVEDNEDGDDKFFDCLPLSKTPLSFLQAEKVVESGKKVEFSTTSQQLHVDIRNVDVNISSAARRSRLLPLPLKSILQSTTPVDTGNSVATAPTSTSSPSGSSGVLSPTSPQTRDRLLADIINEFHLRQKSEGGPGQPPTRRAQVPGARFSKFPSKIFKLLQEEFGEEFYQTFELGEIGSPLSPGDLLHNSLLASGSNCAQHQTLDAGIVKSDSAKSTTSSIDLLEVPVALGNPGPLRRRDFRRPKSPFNKNN